MMTTRTSVTRWETRADWPLAGLAIVFLVVYAIPILDIHLNADVRDCFRAASYVIWGIFAVDYVVRLSLARRWRYFWTHLHDLAMVLLPVLRPLRAVRVLLLLRVLNRRVESSLHGRVALYIGATTVVLIFSGALAELDAERGHSGANINTFGDALWWAIVTICTVGYGDHFPTTDTGRVVAVAVMIGGITLLGLITASLAAWLVQQIGEEERDHAAEVEQRISELTATVAALTEALERDRRDRGGPAAKPNPKPVPKPVPKPAPKPAPTPSTEAVPTGPQR